MKIKEIEIRDWQHLIEVQRPYAIYRGQSDSSWSLSTCLERACWTNDESLDYATERERLLVLAFKRLYHEFSTNIPDYDDEFRWLSLMQHHGAPTRLLDWSYSVLIAAYFSLENSSDEAGREKKGSGLALQYSEEWSLVYVSMQDLTPSHLVEARVCK